MQFSSVLKQVLNVMGVCGVGGGGIKAHSFRIGAAAAAYEAGCNLGAGNQNIRCPLSG